MQNYKVVTGPLKMAAGEIVVLNEKQLFDRRHVVELDKEGKPKLIKGGYKLKQPCDFKSGEIFGYDGVLPRTAEKLVAAEGSDKTISEERLAKRQAESDARAAASLKEFNERQAKPGAKK